MKLRKMCSTVMAFVLLICCITIPTSAKNSPVSEPIQRYYKMSGAEVSSFMKTKIEETGTSVTENSIIELLPLQSSDGGNALVITNQTGNTATKDVLLLVSDEKVGFEQGSSVSTRAGYTVEFPPLSWDGRFVVRATAVYNVYAKHGDIFSSVFQPIGAYFTYQKYESCNVSEITVLYICDGFEYTYPGYQELGTEVEHVITVSKNNPVESVQYSATRPYNTNRVIDVSAGSPFVGQFFTFQTVVNGEFAGHTVAFDGG